MAKCMICGKSEHTMNCVCSECIDPTTNGGGEYNEDGKWQPNKEGLGLGKVLDYIGVKY